MKKTIERSQPLILCEFALNFLIQQKGDVYLETLKFFEDHGYKKYIIKGTSIEKYTWPEARVMNLLLAPKNFDIDNLSRY